eukprot:Hpha_TRINITY_DN23702_c0_g1::TRINITY_DN23702_c0_g1_i1::g.93270::m.93270/K07750/E1.14.13.72, SC4MOL, ERG25; methylsterol monooxygenase
MGSWAGTAGTYVLVLAVVIMSYDFSYLTAVHIVQLGIMIVALIGWVLGSSRLSAMAAKKEEPGRQQRLKQAMALPSDIQVSQEWYTQATKLFKKILQSVGVAAALIVVATVVLAAKRGTSALHLLGDELNQIWLGVTQRHEPREIFVWGTWLAHMVSYWGASLIFAAIDFTRPSVLMPFNIHPNRVVTVKEFCLTSLLVLFNQASVIPGGYLAWHLYSRTSPTGCGAELPSLLELIFNLLVSLPLAEALFWPIHWAFHKYPVLYDRIHSIHHQIMKPFAASAGYCHPIEWWLSNVLPFWIGPLVCGAHVTTFSMVAIIGSVKTCITHSGYMFPHLPATMMHNFHHNHVPGPEGAQNFGLGDPIATLDHLFGTDAFFLSQWQSKIDHTYKTVDFPVEKILAMNGVLNSNENDAPQQDGCANEPDV